MQATEFNIEKLLARKANLNKKLDRLKDLRDNYENAPTTDDYIALQLEELRREKEAKIRQRKENLQNLTRRVQRSKSAVGHRSLMKMIPEETLQRPSLVRGKTFNLEFTLVPKAIEPIQLEPRNKRV